MGRARSLLCCLFFYLFLYGLSLRLLGFDKSGVFVFSVSNALGLSKSSVFPSGLLFCSSDGVVLLGFVRFGFKDANLDVRGIPLLLISLHS